MIIIIVILFLVWERLVCCVELRLAGSSAGSPPWLYGAQPGVDVGRYGGEVHVR